MTIATAFLAPPTPGSLCMRKPKMRCHVVPALLRSVTATLIAGLGAVSQLNGQQRIELGGKKGCESCTIELERVVTLGDREGRGYAGFPVGVGRLSTGEWAMVHAENTTQIAVFDASGRFLRRVGRFGSGPGEFRQIMYLSVEAGDSIWVYDALTGRLSVLGQDLAPRRTLHLGISPPSHFVLQEGGNFVVSTRLHGVEQLGFPLHLFSADGKYLRSLGATNPAYRSGEDVRKYWRSIVSAGDRRIWSARLAEYVLELWSSEGDLLKEYRRSVEWFAPHENAGFNGADHPPNPGLTSIYVDARGRLWTLVRVAGSEWQEGIGQKRHPYGHMVAGVTDRDAYYDTIIEVFDLESGNVLASRRFSNYLTRFTTQGFAIGYREDAAGYPFVDVFDVRLEQGG